MIEYSEIQFYGWIMYASVIALIVLCVFFMSYKDVKNEEANSKK